MDELYHAGKLGRSGRYKWGEGKQPFQRFQRDGSRSGNRAYAKVHDRIQKSHSKTQLRRNEILKDRAEAQIEVADKAFVQSMKAAKEAGIMTASSVAIMAVAYNDLAGLSAAALAMGSGVFIGAGTVALGSLAVSGALKVYSHMKVSEIAKRENAIDKWADKIDEIERREFERSLEK